MKGLAGIRVFGLSGSGMDIDQIVGDIMKAERKTKVTKLERDRQTDLWKQETYQEVNRDLADFIIDARKEFGLSSTTSTGTIINSSSSGFTWVKSSSSSDETKATVSATAKSLNGSYSLNVTQLAESVSKTSIGTITIGTAGTLEEQFGDNFGGDKTLRFTIKTNKTDADGVDFTFDASVSKIDDIIDEINTANIGVAASYDEELDRFFLNTTATGGENYFQITSDEDNFLSGPVGDGTDSMLKLKIQTQDISHSFSTNAIGANTTEDLNTLFGVSNTFNFTIETHKGIKTFNIDDSTTTTMQDLLDMLNSEDTGLVASYDETSDKFFLSAKPADDLGGSWLKVTSDAEGFLSGPAGDGSDNVLNMKLFNNGTQVDYHYNNGKDLQFDFGDAVGLKKSSNTFTLNGMNITAKAQGQTTIAVDTDLDAVYEKISSFVDKYNTLIGEINEKINEKVYRDYYPLSSEEKEALTEEEVKLWEEKAKSGLIKNDSILSGMLASVREDLYKSVSGLDGTINQLTQIGIETGEYSSKGKLIIDETELKNAIIDNVDGVIDLLFNEPQSYIDDEDKSDKSGLITRVFDTIIKDMKDVIDKAGPGSDSELLRDVRSTIMIDFTTGTNLKNGSVSILDEYITDLEEEIARQENILIRMEDRYYSQYSAMETALNQMYQQSSWLMSQLGGM